MSEIPSSKHQAPEKLQTSKHQFRRLLNLELGIWCFSGSWILVLGALMTALMLSGCTHEESAVIYTSQDQEYAEPIFNAFTKQTGIKVLPVYDNEAAKTVGLVNRLIAEKNNPQCDVFWNNEELRTRQLAHDGIVESNWVAFGIRTRRVVVNTNLLPLAKAPQDALVLTNKQYFGKVALAYPLFGTTSTYFLGLRQFLGQTGWENWCRALVANKPFVVDGNSVVVKMVGKGEALVGLTDSDDVINGQHDGLPVDSVRLHQDGFEIPNTAAIVTNCPHPAAAQKLLDYLKSPEVLAALRKAGAVETNDQITERPVNWNDLLANQNINLDFLKGLFLR